MDLPADGRRRVIIDAIRPSIDCGRFPIKRVVGDQLTIEADAFTDGHDEIVCLLQYRIADVAAQNRRPPGSKFRLSRWATIFGELKFV